MQYFNFYKRVFFSYLFIILFTSLFLIVKCEFQLELISNLFENIFFALLVIAPSFFLENKTLRKFYGLFAFLFFSITIMIESIYYFLFQVFFSASTIFVVMESNLNEAIEYVNFYFGLSEALYLFSTIFLIVVLKRSIKSVYSELKFPIRRKALASSLLIFIIFSSLKYSQLIIYNFPYLFIKSSIEYYQTSKNFDLSSKNKDGYFTNVQIKSTKINPVFVLVLGESTVRSHMQLYGYRRNTNPRLAELSDQLMIYEDVISPHALTVESVTKMLTLSNFESNEIKKGSIIQLANAAGYTTSWLSNQRPVGIFESLITKIALSASKSDFISTAYGQHNRTLDQDLLPLLSKELNTQSNDPKFIIIHLMGTHFKYENRYPDSLNKFFTNPKPNKYLSEIELIKNKYDRAVLNNDYVVYEIIKSVKQSTDCGAVLYVSDHGEELEEIKYRGHNEDYATKDMFDIPFFLWQSEKHRKFSPVCYDPNRQYMNDDLFHSLADILEIRAEEVDSVRSIFSKSYKERKRLILGGQDYDTKFSVKNLNNLQN